MVGTLRFARPTTFTRALAVAIICLATPCDGAVAGEASIVPADLPPAGTIDERFQSFNIEMVEVTGGPFWKPYAAEDGLAKPQAKARSAARKSDLFANRSLIDLTNPRLRKFASALSPAYLRVS